MKTLQEVVTEALLPFQGLVPTPDRQKEMVEALVEAFDENGYEIWPSSIGGVEFKEETAELEFTFEYQMKVEEDK